MPNVHSWPAQQRVRYDAVAAALPPEIAGCARVVLVTTRSLADSRIAAATRAAIGDVLIAETSAMGAHSPFEDVLALAALLRDRKADRVVALGGGSVIDGTKAACLALWHGAADLAALRALAVARGTHDEGWDAIEPTPRIVAVPTTFSAAEFAPFAGATDKAAGRKYRFAQSSLVPRAVVMDPAATLETPAELLLSSGIRAVDHAAERWCALQHAPFSDAVSLQAMELLARALPAIKADPASLAARAEAQQAMWLSTMGGLSGVPVGASHGIGYILGGARGVPHGITSCLGLPAVMAWNTPVNAARQADVARIFGGSGAPDDRSAEGREGLDPPRDPISASEALRSFIRGLGLPTTLAEVGIPLEDIPALAAMWDGGAPIATNPRKVRNAEDVAEIMRLMV